MNSIARTFLTVYLVIATLASIVFGYLYFKDKNGDPFELTMEAVEEIIVDARNVMKAGKPVSVAANSVEGGQDYVYASDGYDVKSYFTSVAEADLNVTQANSVAWAMDTYAIMAQCFVYPGTEYDKFYKSTRTQSDGSVDTMLYKVELIENMGALIQSHYMTEKDGNIISYIDMEWTINVMTEGYFYVIEAKISSNKITDSKSELVYMNFAKPNNATQFAYFNCTRANINGDLDTVLSTTTAEADISNQECELFDFVNQKQKMTADKTCIANALNGLKPYLRSYVSFRTATTTTSNYFTNMANLMSAK
ncbi:MAG: hypothetical protein IKC79_01045 [Clostridia bacterium]|nr:hypothetical protein [Clostridia bacterium]